MKNRKKLGKDHYHYSFTRLSRRINRNEDWATELCDPDLPRVPASKSYINTFLFNQFPDLPVWKSFSKFQAWMGTQPTLPANVKVARDAAMWTRRNRSRLKRNLIQEILLNPNSPSAKAAIQAFRDSIPIVRVPRLSKPYPPPGHWVIESEEIKNIWKNHLQNGKQPDKRVPRRPMAMVNFSKLQENLTASRSADFVDDETGEPILLIARELCAKESLKEDGGCLVLTGWSAGSRSRPQFDFARNFLRKQTEDQKKSIRYQAASVFALFWNLVRALGPVGAVQDMENFLEESGIYRMDTGALYEDCKGAYTIEADGVPMRFADAHMAPPSGVMARNYCRVVHREKQPHRYAFSWTTYRAPPVIRNLRGKATKVQQGGHFYLASHGIRVESSSNYLAVWDPNLEEGSSNPKWARNRNVAETSGVFKKFLEEKISEEELSKACRGEEDDAVVYTLGDDE
ncbi:hypothetical protein D9757_008252 [Collybiopsis confluens]|uniref:Uncharacterized protein n=1 Tax=Collybiopsis confluens TaxID=2823264 RepID=A0A8H5M4C8_9AGAR|nr:hypothetical protein D9757_008252 [Collybiopsis confluens]